MRALFTMAFASVLSVYALGAPACGGGGDSENTGHTCMTTDDCYPGIDTTMIQGDIECLTQVEGGYCTHLCETDADCCAVAGECQTGLPQLCAPFESTGVKHCFLSCEPSVIGDTDANTFCQDNADSAFGCRSTGGGSENKQVCVPPG